MKTLLSRFITVLACFFIFSAAWFCLWSISLHLVERPELAVLLFPFGLRLGLMLQCPRGYWPVLLGAEWLLTFWLAQEVALAHLPLLLIGGLLTLLPVALISRYRHQRDWRTLLLQGAALTAAALLQSLPWLGQGEEAWNALLLTLTGGLTLAPICLVFWHYLTSTTWLPLGPALVSQPVNWRGRHLIWYLLLFSVSLWLQYVYLASLFALGFLVFGPQLLIGVAAVGFVPKKAIGAADGIKGTFAYLIGDSFAKLGLGMIADGTPVFGLTGWAGTFAALDAAAIGCICLMAMVAVMEERKIRRERKIQQLRTA